MFSGIVEEAAKVVKLEKDKGNLHITMSCSFADQLKIDQSVCHNGVCLTVVKFDKAKKEFSAGRGEDGGKKSLHGKNGEDFFLELPILSISRPESKTYYFLIILVFP